VVVLAIIDEKDMKIISMLLENGRITYSEIAKAIGISDVAVIKRIKRLEQMGVIRKYTVLIDPKKIGYKAISITGIDVEPEYVFNILNILKEKDYVKYLAIASGDHDIIATIWAKDSDDIAKIHGEIAKIDGVKRVCPAIILDIIKE